MSVCTSRGHRVWTSATVTSSFEPLGGKHLQLWEPGAPPAAELWQSCAFNQCQRQTHKGHGGAKALGVQSTSEGCPGAAQTVSGRCLFPWQQTQAKFTAGKLRPPSTAPGYHLQAVETGIYEMQECPLNGVYRCNFRSSFHWIYQTAQITLARNYQTITGLICPFKIWLHVLCHLILSLREIIIMFPCSIKC